MFATIVNRALVLSALLAGTWGIVWLRNELELRSFGHRRTALSGAYATPVPSTGSTYYDIGPGAARVPPVRVPCRDWVRLGRASHGYWHCNPRRV
ncbi:hypothetical protein BV20DRAFT_968537 [Pilatotrama ljubarskyi]|nr:hypothetical protein BV20DRAFT_968537 [Pilatotrama ljubarskyi]